MTEFPDTQSSLLAGLRTFEDRQAWERFVSLYRPLIYRIARKRGFQEADAEDVTQRIMISIANSVHRWQKQDETTRFRHWVRRIAKNAIINAVQRKPQPTASIDAHDHLLADASDAQSEKEIELEFRREIYRQAAAQVKIEVAEETWIAFELTVIEGKSVEETADQLNKSKAAIYAGQSRVMRRLHDAVNRLEGLTT